MIRIEPITGPPAPKFASLPQIQHPLSAETLRHLLLSVIAGFLVALYRHGGALNFRFAISVILSVGGVFAGATVTRRLKQQAASRRIKAAQAHSRDLARRFGYVPSAEGGAFRHRVTIRNVEAIWTVDDFALDELGLGYFVRTAEDEYIYCAGEPFLNNDEGDDDFDVVGPFDLAESLIFELRGDLQFIDTAIRDGRRIPVAGGEVPTRAVPRWLVMTDFAILDDSKLIRRLQAISSANAEK